MVLASDLLEGWKLNSNSSIVFVNSIFTAYSLIAAWLEVLSTALITSGPCILNLVFCL